MTEITRNDVIDVGGGGGRCGESVGARSSTPAVAADAGSEGGGGAEWQMVTRGKAKADESVNDKLTAMAATMEQLMAVQKETAES